MLKPCIGNDRNVTSKLCCEISGQSKTIYKLYVYTLMSSFSGTFPLQARSPVLWDPLISRRLK